MLDRLNHLVAGLALSIFLFGFTRPVFAVVYKWKDENGHLCFADDLSAVPLDRRSNSTVEIMQGMTEPSPPSPSRPSQFKDGSKGRGAGKRVAFTKEEKDRIVAERKKLEKDKLLLQVTITQLESEIQRDEGLLASIPQNMLTGKYFRNGIYRCAGDIPPPADPFPMDAGKVDAGHFPVPAGNVNASNINGSTPLDDRYPVNCPDNPGGDKYSFVPGIQQLSSGKKTLLDKISNSELPSLVAASSFLQSSIAQDEREIVTEDALLSGKKAENPPPLFVSTQVTAELFTLKQLVEQVKMELGSVEQSLSDLLVGGLNT